MNALTEYRRLRRETATLGAQHALRWAKSIVKPTEFEFHQSGRGSAVSTARATREGFDIRIDVEYDDYDAESRVTGTDKDTGIRNPKFNWSGDSWNHRHDRRFLELESGSTVREIATCYHDMGMARHVAWETARQSLQKEAEGYIDNDTQYAVIVTASLDGIDLGDASIGGVETTYRTHDRDIEDVVAEGCMIDEAIEHAREELARLVASAAKLTLDRVAQVC